MNQSSQSSKDHTSSSEMESGTATETNGNPNSMSPTGRRLAILHPAFTTSPLRFSEILAGIGSEERVKPIDNGLQTPTIVSADFGALEERIAAFLISRPDAVIIVDSMTAMLDIKADKSYEKFLLSSRAFAEPIVEPVKMTEKPWIEMNQAPWQRRKKR